MLLKGAVKKKENILTRLTLQELIFVSLARNNKEYYYSYRPFNFLVVRGTVVVTINDLINAPSLVNASCKI